MSFLVRRRLLKICFVLLGFGCLFYIMQFIDLAHHHYAIRHHHRLEPRFHQLFSERNERKSKRDKLEGLESDAKRTKEECFLPVDEHQFQKVEESELFIVSALLGDRNETVGKVVRILGLAPYQHSDVLCQLVYESGEVKLETATIEVFLEVIPPFCKWKTTFIYCPVSNQQDHEDVPVGVSLSPIDCTTFKLSNYLTVNTIHGNPTYKLVLCTDTMYNYTDADAGPFIEFIEM